LQAYPASRLIVWLHEPAALDAAVTGAKAANLAHAMARGLPVLPGFVVTTAAAPRGSLPPELEAALHNFWEFVCDDWPGPWVVRSSSTVEDSTTASMAGQFTSVLGVFGFDALVEAVRTVLASAGHPRDERTTAKPMAVLVQPQLDTECAGVLFGLDPVTGDVHHLVVEAVPGTPDGLVSGTVTAAHCVLSRRGRLAGGRSEEVRALLGPSRRRRLARLARTAADAFGGPQDVEWAFDLGGELWMLQSRAVTATGDVDLAAGPILGPGPVAETFPEPLRPLEIALWAEPLRAAVVGAIGATAAVSRRRLARSPVVTEVGGRLAADLELFGSVPPGGRARRWFRPLAGLRRVMVAWRVGRLRAALPALAADVVRQADADLCAVGELSTFSGPELVDVLERLHHELVALHGHEVLAGMLLRDDVAEPSLATAALAALRRGRADGLDDAAIVARDPVVLALTPPAVDPDGRVALPALAGDAGGHPVAVGELGWRDALRLRSRWAQELGARIAAELGRRLAAEGLLPTPTAVADLRLDELRVAVEQHRMPDGVARRAAVEPGAPLPVAFRLTPTGEPVAVAGHHRRHRDGLPAGGGRAVGVVRHQPPETGERCVLVVDTLDPRLAPLLPALAGLVSETGSALSHLAILAREMHVPTVVGVPEARHRFPDGTNLLVDGTTGELRLCEEVAS
jgi:pyruvate,water dikinase